MKNNSVKGDVLGWGTGAYGRLGRGSPSDCLSPKSICSNQIDGRGIMCVSAGLYHSAIVTDDHGVYVFGTNATGCLGLGRGASTMTSSDDSAGNSDGLSEQTHVPRRIRTFPSRINIVQVSVGGDLMGSHTLAVSSQGRLYSWGAAKSCGVGAVEGEDIIRKPTLVTEFVRSEDSLQDATTERVIYASAGGSCSAVITAEGVLYTFGITASGRLGYRERLRVQYRPRRVDALLGESISAVSVGGAHMLCVSHRGVLYAWGDNSRGQLGLGDLVDRSAPTRVPHPRQGFWSASIAAGQFHSLAVDIEGRLYSWGASGRDCIGRGESLFNTERERVLCTSFQIRNLLNSWMKPGQVILSQKVSRVSAGAHHSVITTTTGLVFTFGSKNQIGLGEDHLNSTSLLSVPRLLAISDPVAISCGNYHSLMVLPSAFHHPGLDRLVSTFSTRTSFHDCYVESMNGSVVCLNSVAVRACVTLSAWVSFLVPQLKFINPLPPKQVCRSSPDLQEESTAAEEFRFTPDLPSETESTMIGSVLDDWVRDSPVADIPSECVFANLSVEFVYSFFTSVFLDDIVETNDEDLLRALLRLSICCQLDRVEKLATKRIKRMNRDRTYILTPIPPGRDRLDRAIDLLFNSRDDTGDVAIECGLPIVRDVLNETSTCIRCHSFILESLAPKSIPPSVPKDIMAELVHFGYKLKYSSPLSHESAETGLAVRFWLMVAHTAMENFGNLSAFAAAIDRVISLVSSDSWEQVQAQFLAFMSAGIVPNPAHYKQIAEAIISVGSNKVCDQILSSKTFNAVNTYTYSKQELPGAIKRALTELDFGDLSSDLISRVNETIEAHVHMARLLRREMDHYRELEVLANGGMVEKETGLMKRWFHSMSISHRGGPSVMSAFRDLAIFVVLFAIASAYVVESTWAKKFLPTNYWSTFGILSMNLVFLLVAGYLIYTGVVTSKV